MPASTQCIEPLEARIAPAFAANLHLGALDGKNGFELSGEESEYDLLHHPDRLGLSADIAGDVNGDGFADLIVGAPDRTGTTLAGERAFENGAVFVLFGGSGDRPANLKPSALNGQNGFRLSGEAEYSHAGKSVSAAGDVNGDGFDDLIIGARGTSSDDDEGAAYVLFGKAGGFSAELNLGALDGSNGFKLAGSGIRSPTYGFAVSSAGDVNGDGFDDVIIGVSDSGYASFAYVVFGKAGGFAANFDLETLDGSSGFRLRGEHDAFLSDETGRSVSAAGDVNGDGFDDVIVGAPGFVPAGGRNGSAYVVFGHADAFDARIDLPTLDGSDGFRMDGSMEHYSAGGSVGDIGDINGDGFADILVAAVEQTYVIYGHSGSFPARLALSAIDGMNGFTMNRGAFPANAGDVNADGVSDFIVGYASTNGTGAAFVVFGQLGGLPANIDIFTLDGQNGFRLSGVSSSDFVGYSVGGGGDINGDGFPDLIIGAPLRTGSSSGTGKAYVVYGGDLPGQADITPDGHQAIFTDPDGDLVTVTTTTGTFTKEMFDLHADGLGYQLQKLDLTAPAFAGANITITAARHNADGVHGKEGNGMVDIGYIDATGIALGKVKLPGDLGQIDAGAVQVLSLGSLGTLGTATQDPAAPSLHSDLTGSLGKLKIHGNLSGATLAVTGKIGPVRIAGDVDGATLTALGTLTPANALEAVAIASVKIGGNVTNSQILAGYDLTGAALNADASIGKIIVQGNWLASSLIAGIADSTQDGFGQNDTLIPGGSDSIIAKIAGITIKGTATGSTATDDFFGLTAELIKKAKINGVALALTPNKDDLPLDAANNDFRLVEV